MTRTIPIISVLVLATVLAAAGAILLGIYLEPARTPTTGWSVAITVVSAILVGIFPLLGETIIEDVVKAVFICLLGLALWHFRAPRWICLVAFCGSIAGVAANRTIRFLTRKPERQDTMGSA